MLAAIAETPGPIDTVVIRDVPEPEELHVGQVVVRMLASRKRMLGTIWLLPISRDYGAGS